MDFQDLGDAPGTYTFSGAFTQANNMTLLRHALLEVAQKVLGPVVSDVLIVDIVRQDN